MVIVSSTIRIGRRAFRRYGSTHFLKQATTYRPVALQLLESPILSGIQQQQKMSFHFGLPEYAATFRDIPKADMKILRESALAYLKTFDPKSWYDDPITSIVNGEKLSGSNPIDTKDALGVVNGSQYLATPEQVEKLKKHICTYKPPTSDLRDVVRKIEGELLTTHAGFLIGNQCIDFGKQDGVTEIEESTMANAIEQRLNDLLLRDEANGVLTVNRKPIYVSCVSNFTNFLDLFRKTLRSIEVGTPCIILSRSNTVQHSYRWTQLLLDLFKENNVDPGMLTYLSCSLDDIINITSSCKDHTGNLYSTCSRQLAKDIMKTYPDTITSTGGPNTLVAKEFTKEVASAIKTSACIESSGQCTALRHCVVPTSTQSSQLEDLFQSIEHLPSGQTALEKGAFDTVFKDHKGSPEPTDSNYKHLEGVNAYLRINDNDPPPTDISEYWRKVVVDFTKMDFSTEKHEEQVAKLAKWLNKTQPISLAVNAPRSEAMDLGVELFDRTGMVVYTIGSTDDKEMPPALSCQARPQEAEVFGEFPPRATLREYTKYPVVVPSSTPSYDSHYKTEYLKSYPVDDYTGKSTDNLLQAVSDEPTRGYCRVLINYLQKATKQNPKVGFGSSRTALWGLQKPPLGTKSFLRCNANVTWDAAAPSYILFHTTTARDQIELSVDPQNKEILSLCENNKIKHVVETEEDFTARSSAEKDATTFCVLKPTETMKAFPMAGQFVSLHFPIGHIKSTKPNDEEFILRFSASSKKWLETLF